MLKDELHPWVMDNFKKIINVALEYDIEDAEFWYGRDSEGRDGIVFWMGNGPLPPSLPEIILERNGPLEGLEEEGLVSVRYGRTSGREFYRIKPRGIRAVEENFEIPSVYDGVPSIQVDNQYINVAYGPGAVAEQVLGDLGDSNAELTKAIRELADAVSNAPADCPSILSKLLPVMKVLIQAPDLIEVVKPFVMEALKMVGLSS